MRWMALLIPAAAPFVAAQASLGTHPILLNGDMAVLEAGEPRTDLACMVAPLKPLLGFDLKFHSGFDLQIPLRDLQGNGNVLSVLFRVSPKSGDPAPMYFHQQFRVPPISEDKGDVTLQGWFDVGQGSYHVDWLVHDFAGRFCSSSWETEAELDWKSKQMTLTVPANAVREAEDEKFQPEPPVERERPASTR